MIMSQNLWRDPRPLLLASTSRTRLKLLQDIALPVETEAANVDERIIEAELHKANIDPAGVALALAHEKAADVAKRNPDRWIIGADQTLALGAEQFHKPISLDGARDHLRRMRGQTHQLHSADRLSD